MFGWEGFVTLEATLAAATLPTKLLEFRFEIAEPLEATSNPFTVREFRIPKLVILGWAGWVTTRAVLALATLPTRFEEFRFEIAEPLEATSNPFTVREFRIPKLVMLGWAGWVTTRAVLALATFPTKLLEFRFEIAEPLPMYRLARTVERFETP
jgi:hypothetical protein